MSDQADVPDIETQLKLLGRRCDRILTESDLRSKLSSGRPLRIKLGMDPTAPDVTLGHCVPLKVIRQFQEWGHKAVLIIGDYTARVGDPTGVNSTRPMLTGDEIDRNAETYVQQIGKVLLTGDEHLEVRRNGEWLGKLDLVQLIKLAARKTVAQVLDRDDFQKRYAAKQEIGLHEFLYPLLQGYDSLAVQADVEMGGSDQLFNNLVGREFQQAEGQSPPAGQCVIVTPLLVGTDGSVKMSKSKGNYIAVTDPAGGDGGIFGKVMSLPDAVMGDYFRLLTDVPEQEYTHQIQDSPRDAKVRLAKLIISEFHDDTAADAAEQAFMTATHGGIPDDVETRVVGPGPHMLAKLLVDVGFCTSNSEANRLVKQGGVKLDGDKLTDPRAPIDASGVLQAGKRKFVRLAAT
ncbi:MAG: tyrosine--tRNA ligase [Planctomycetota bacterium]